MTLPLNTSLKDHTIIAVLISLWLVLFLILIAPFDAGDLDFAERLEILPFYGVLSFIVYMVLTPIQNRVYRHYKTWNITLEFLFILTFNAILICCCFTYYKTDIVNGTYGFKTFVLEVYLPICFVLLTIIIFLRWFFNKKTTPIIEEKIVITGDNKHDVVQLLPSELICVSSADNYVEVCYLNKGELQKKLLRSTLKVIQNKVPILLKVHRSYLINPLHFKAWNGSASIILTKMEIPVSKNYKASILELDQSSLKTNTLSQS